MTESAVRNRLRHLLTLALDIHRMRFYVFRCCLTVQNVILLLFADVLLRL